MSDWEDRIEGGLADRSDPGQFDRDQLSAGVEVEMEHTDDPAVAAEIAMDHLIEDPLYYEKLKGVEGKPPRMSEVFAVREEPWRPQVDPNFVPSKPKTLDQVKGKYLNISDIGEGWFPSPYQLQQAELKGKPLKWDDVPEKGRTFLTVYDKPVRKPGVEVYHIGNDGTIKHVGGAISSKGDF